MLEAIVGPFDDLPEQLRDIESMPWEEIPAVVWPFGADLGKLLSDIPSRELVRKRKWLEERETHPELIEAIDQVLTERGGEI